MRFHLPARSGLSQAITIATLLFSSLVLSLPAADHYANGSTIATVQTSDLQKREVPDFYLRILPLGASITWGMGSSDNNGYRKYLRDTLRQAGYKVNMVGNRNNGDMLDNDVEGTSGHHVSQVHAAALTATKYKPNIVLINAGTNDAREHDDIGEIGERMNALIDDLQREIPGVTILLSTILRSTNTEIMKNWLSVNIQYQHIAIHRRYALNQKVILVDFEKPGFDWNIPLSLLGDGIHPVNEGYERMAAAWYQGILEADRAGFLSAPAQTSFADDGSGQTSNTCDKVYGVSRGPIQTQAGSGLDDGLYTHNSASRGVRVMLYSYSSVNPFVFARLSADTDRHYIVEVTDRTETNGRYHTFYRPTTAGSWEVPGVDFLVPDGCIRRGVRWHDTNADGRDDMLCVSPNGDTYVTHNLALDSPMPPPVPMVFSGLWKRNEGYAQDRVHIADIDGDGRADYCVVQDNGDVRCWRNGGQGDMPEYWQPMGIVFKSKGMGDPLGVRFYDINGDGRDDWLWMDNTGLTHTYTNNRGCTKGNEGQGLTPNWRAATSNPTHAGLGIANIRDQIHFANVYDSPAAFGLSGRGDYVLFERGSQTAFGDYRYEVKVWQNLGSGGSKLKADGTRHCNMRSNLNGAEDLVWVHSTGYMRIYESKGGSFSTAPFWGPNYIIWDLTATRQMDRRDLHLADWDGDGLCDIIWVQPGGPVVDVWINKFGQNRNFNTWEYRHDVGPKNGVYCPKRGKGIFDLGVRFADLDGNGMADMICLEKNGHASGWLNTNGGKTLTWHQQFKFSEGKDRANLRFADVNGDGRADLLWIDKFNGDTTVWYNRGPIPASGSSFTWDPKGKLFQGAMQGSCTMYPDLDGNSRADMTAVDAVTNEATTWFNDCGGRGGDDHNTHTTRAQIPAPEVDVDVALLLAARWPARRNNIEYHRLDDFTYGEMEWEDPKAIAKSLNFHTSCEYAERSTIYSAWMQFWKLAKHNHYKFRYGEYSWEDQIAKDFWGAPNVFTTDLRRRVEDVLQYLMNWAPGDESARVAKKLNVACHLKCGPYLSAYVMNPNQNHQYFPTEGSMTFCPPFFDTEKDLKDAMFQYSQEIDDYKNRATVMFHELLHLHEVSRPSQTTYGDISDVPMNFTFYAADGPPSYGEAKAYGGAFAKALAVWGSKTGDVHTHRNSDSYMLSTLGSYARENSLARAYPHLPLAGSPPNNLLPYRRRRGASSSSRRRQAVGGGGGGAFNSTLLPSTNTTASDGFFAIEGALVLYANGTGYITPQKSTGSYFDYPVPADMAPVVISYETLAGGNASSPEYDAYLEANGEEILARQRGEGGSVSPTTVVPEPPASTTSAAASPMETSGVMPSSLAELEIDADGGVRMNEYGCAVGETLVDCIAG